MALVANIFGGQQPGTASQNFGNVGAGVSDVFAGFGFITCPDGSEIYFHATTIESNKPLTVGDRVKFIEGFSRDGRRRARNVAVIASVGSRS